MRRLIIEKETTDPERKNFNERILEGVRAFPGGVQRLQEWDEKLETIYAAIPEGGRFEFLKEWFCSEGEREDEGKGVTVEQAEKKNGESEAQAQKVPEWTGYDSEAERELTKRIYVKKKLF